MTLTKEEAAKLRDEARERERTAVKLQEDWFDSPEFKQARGEWLISALSNIPFEDTQFYTNARYLYRKRVNGGGDGNDG